jgi:hypothetical protein
MYQPTKLFSVEEANQTLPLVSRIMQDIVRVNNETTSILARMRRLGSQGRAQRLEESEVELREREGQIAEYIEELESIGCLCKDPLLGLVDFPSRRQGRTVFLCWKLGEEEIRFWHELESGFAGRKPVQEGS